MKNRNQIINSILMIFVDDGWKLSTNNDFYILEKVNYGICGYLKVNKNCRNGKTEEFIDSLFENYYNFNDVFNICGNKTKPVRCSFISDIGKSLVKVNNFFVKHNLPVKYMSIGYFS